ncbi:hypothetical protein HD806DRAFT_498249 [Xylariaceae sp. AK1471]|nr:hypothetical protein HD806DRAFT_498249 [Xylariaceae sp. AK1471]
MATPEANRQPIVNGESQINGEFKPNGQSYATSKPIVNRKPLLPYPVGQFVSPSNIFQDCAAKKRSSLCETSSVPRAKRQMTSAPPPSFVNAPINIDRPVLDEELGFLAPYLSDGTKVLHLGCREGDVTKDICEEVSPNGLVYGIDLYPTNIRKANGVAGLTNVIFRRVPDMTTLPFQEDFFDVVYASDLVRA